ncbi:hypothetical protein [Halorussus halophilus]|uniref:hypothetical protein n=1 Tax=Halorussus halophilus TaxID=2650975 RepID=UPI00130121C4|nr:hypothetical protein [Halorussus halophilus]
MGEKQTSGETGITKHLSNAGDQIIHRSKTSGRSGGVGNPLTFAPLHDTFERASYYIRSADAHEESSSFVAHDIAGEVFGSLTNLPGVDSDSGWWCIDQTDGAWWGTGLHSFAKQFQVPAKSHFHIENTHHNGSAVWIAPVGDRLRGVEAVTFAGDPSDQPGDGKTLRESIRRPTISFLLSAEQPSGLAEATRTVNMPFYTNQEKPESELVGSAEKDEWKDRRGTFAIPASNENLQARVCQSLEQTDGPHGPEVEVTNPYFGLHTKAAEDFGRAQLSLPDAQNLAYRFAAYERLSAHPPDITDLSNLSPGDQLKVTSIELTYLPECGISFAPANAEVHVTQ